MFYSGIFNLGISDYFALYVPNLAYYEAAMFRSPLSFGLEVVIWGTSTKLTFMYLTYTNAKIQSLEVLFVREFKFT